MNQAVAERLFPAGRAARAPSGRRPALAALVVLTLASPLLFGFRAPYWRSADPDLILAYQGLVFGDGLPQEFFDHTGYLYFFVLAGWNALLHGLGLMPVHALSELPPASDTAAFEAAWQGIVQSGRALSIALSLAFVLVFAAFVRRLVHDWRIGALAGLALAFSVGMVIHARLMRTELLSVFFVMCSLFPVLLAARTDGRTRRWRLAALALAGLCAALAVLTKVQAVFPVLAVPVLALAFGERHEPSPARWSHAALLAAIAAVPALAAAALLRHGVLAADHALYAYRPLAAGLSGVYQPLIGLYVAAAVAVYARIWRVPAIEAVMALAAVILGLSLGILALELRYHELNVIAVANFVEHMHVFSTWSNPAALGDQTQVLSGSLFALLAKGLARTLAIRTFVLHPSGRQTLLLEWFVLAGVVVAWRRGDRRFVLRAGLLLLAVWGLESLFSLRGERLYAVYTDPLVILAAALTLARFPRLLAAPAQRRALAAAMALYVILAHTDAVRNYWTVRSTPSETCYWHATYLKRVTEPFPFCRS